MKWSAIMDVVFSQIVLLIAISGEYCEQYTRQFSGSYIELLPFRWGGVFFIQSLRKLLCFCFFQSKFQKHQAFEAEVSANQERVLETINLAEGKNDILQMQSLTPEPDMEMCWGCNFYLSWWNSVLWPANWNLFNRIPSPWYPAFFSIIRMKQL